MSERIKTQTFDYIIIGGGISGFYTVHKILEKYGDTKSILLLDERSYFGGRLLTNKQPKFEVGGARFNDNHVLLKELLKIYDEKYTKLPSRIDYIHKDDNKTITYYDHADETFEGIMKQIIKQSKSCSKQKLRSMTLAQYIDDITDSCEMSEKLINIFGYNTEFTKMNAYDSLESMDKDFVATNFYVLNKGFSHLMESMHKSFQSRPNVLLHKFSQVLNVKTRQDKTTCYDVITKNTKTQRQKTYQGKHIVFAIKSGQLRQFSLLSNIHKHLDCIHEAPLLRIYARYPQQKSRYNGPWFQKLPRMTTNSFLRHIIPIDPSTGLIMISYTDGDDITPFYHMNTKTKKVDKTRLKSDEEIKKMISRELDIIFPEFVIPQPIYFKTYLWHVGTHHWKPGCESSKIIRCVQNPLKNVYIVGEAFSRKQAWVEGALESVRSID